MLCGATRSPHRENYSVLKLCRRASAKSLGYRLSGERRLFLEKKGWPAQLKAFNRSSSRQVCSAATPTATS
ncbi:hypothetical protein GBAR_LOCUS12868 [Geodia barretti]|uniref:Uncharacterized protein n=1 Tax=Geodia barretti TaxID=519541 RepID=A0AA35S1P1_GEOBA|nr:hypothetical protein GBAR_LOCUS12868 [Geodia barretti]